MDNENKKELPLDETLPEENNSFQDALAALRTYTAPEADESEKVEAELAGDPAPELDPDLEPDLSDNPEFQAALDALKAFTARYESEDDESTPETPAGEPANNSTIAEEAQMQVTEDTVPFTTPVAPLSEDMGATQKFTTVDETGTQKETSPRKKRRRPPARKGRPEPKKGYGLFGLPHIAATIIWLALIVTIGISFGRVLWVCAADLLAFGKPDEAITVTIEKNDSIHTIANKLQKAGLIRYPKLFVFFADLTGKGEKVLPDTYTLNSMYDYNALLKMMSYKQTNTDVVDVVIPEGYNCAQIFKLLEEKGVCSQAKLEEWAANGELKDYWFLEGVPRGTKYCLEGYLYPDTYKFYTDADPQYVLQKLLNAFDTRFSDKMYADFLKMQDAYAQRLRNSGLSSSYIEANKLTFHKLITLASMVEEETTNASEGYEIASVFYNRLTKPASYPTLDSDPTVYYAMGVYYDRKELSKEDLKFNSPYNTYVSRGLPPGPITNPGPYSIYAALYPSDTSYHFFVFDKSINGHRFSKTLQEHNDWIAQIGANK
ncbi:MAG: endolytic transglycosylase MltG [Ruminococcaceae bacterium]|nr:endolytic transglycosylase MltG [Oscillospiraceae bacterium]